MRPLLVFESNSVNSILSLYAKNFIENTVMSVVVDFVRLQLGSQIFVPRSQRMS